MSWLLTSEELRKGLHQVQCIAESIFSRGYFGLIELDDLVNSGTIGLLNAAERYDGQKGANFKTYAEHRIRGSILDWLRKCDPVNRAYRKRISNGDATDVSFVSIEDPSYVSTAVENNRKTNPLEICLSKEVREVLAKMIETLSEREQLVLYLYYVKECPMKEISDQIEVTEGRVSQIHNEILDKMRKNLQPVLVSNILKQL